jgi:hypothetical protein
MSFIKNLSVSSVGHYMKCARSWKFCYVDGIRFPATPDMLFGTAFHNAVEAFIRSGHEADLTTLFRDEWARAVGSAREVTCGRRTYEGMMALGVKMSASPAIVGGLARIGVAVTDADAPMIEYFFKFDISGVDVPFLGYIDIVDDEGVVGDFKTSRRPWEPIDAKMSLQAPLYIAGLRSTGRKVPGIFRHHVLTKNRAGYELWETEVTEERIAWAFEQVRAVWLGVKHDAFPASTSMGWWCSAAWCPYWDVCGRAAT